MTAACPPVLLPLLKYLDHLKGRAELPDLHMLLTTLSIAPGDVRDCAKFDDTRYCRNLIASGPWYDLLVICWKSGQRSPIHDHAGSSCAFKVLTGACSETVYAFSPCGQVYPTHTIRQPAGAVVATEDEDTHQVSNLEPCGQDLITLHIYSPPLKSMHTFSILGEGTREWKAPQGQDTGVIYGDAI